MGKMVELRWHGRGGQGAKTASLLLAEAAFDTGKYIQGFPEYGPERMGAPITAYNRISDEKITSKDPEELRPLLKGYQGKSYTVDARTISVEELGRYFPNVPMLGAIVKVAKLMDEDIFVEAMEKSFHHKFATKPLVIEGNMRALKRAMQEVKGL